MVRHGNRPGKLRESARQFTCIRANSSFCPGRPTLKGGHDAPAYCGYRLWLPDSCRLCLNVSATCPETPGETPAIPSDIPTSVEELMLSHAAESAVAIDEHMIVSQAELRLKTDSPDSVHRQSTLLTLERGGYVLLSEPDRITVRVPSSEFNGILEQVRSLGEVVDQSVQGSDVTDRYRDLQIRLDNALRTRERFLKLLDAASTMEDILRLERELSRLNHTIETLKGEIYRLEHKQMYSTITVSTAKETKAGPVGFAFESLFKGVKWLFVRN